MTLKGPFRRGPRPAKFVDYSGWKIAASCTSVVLALGLVLVGGYLGVTLQDGLGAVDGLLAIGVLALIVGQHLLRHFTARFDRGSEGAMQAFADNLPQAVNKIIRFMGTGMTQADAEQLRVDLTSATSAMVGGGRRCRVCVYRVDRRDVENGKDNRFLVKVHSDGRPDPARDVFTADEPHGKALIDAVYRGGQIPVQNVENPPIELPTIDTGGVKSYQSFILTPIRRDGNTWGAVTVDYEGVGHLTKIDGAISSSIARVFESSFAVIKHGGEDLSKSERQDVRSEVEAIQALKRRLRGDSDG